MSDNGQIVHVIKRGARGMPIVENDAERYRFLKALYFLNDANHPTPWLRDVERLGTGLRFDRPSGWEKKREPLVSILSFCLLDNHFHLLLRECSENGIPRFLSSLNSSMSQSYNEAHGTQGSIFQGKAKKRFVEHDHYYSLLLVYINVKNAFDCYPGGMEKALEDFDKAYAFALKYPFCSLADVVGNRESPIVHQDTEIELSQSASEFKKFARMQMENYELFRDQIKDLL